MPSLKEYPVSGEALSLDQALEQGAHAEKWQNDYFENYNNLTSAHALDRAAAAQKVGAAIVSVPESANHTL